MNILNIEHVSKVFGEKVVLDDVSYGVHQGDKIGIIGINGTGKSTILKIIGGLEEPDEGQVITQNGLRITYLPQMPEFPQGASVLDYVAEGKWQKDWSRVFSLCSIVITSFPSAAGLPCRVCCFGQLSPLPRISTLPCFLIFVKQKAAAFLQRPFLSEKQAG